MQENTKHPLAAKHLHGFRSHLISSDFKQFDRTGLLAICGRLSSKAYGEIPLFVNRRVGIRAIDQPEFGFCPRRFENHQIGHFSATSSSVSSSPLVSLKNARVVPGRISSPPPPK